MSPMAASSCSQRYYVFPSFHRRDIHNTFLSHLFKALNNKSIPTLRRDHMMDSTAFFSVIPNMKISIVIFSTSYALSTCCLNELVEIHKCYKGSLQKVIPIFYNVDHSEVREQTREFGKIFEETCMNKPEHQKKKWKQALTDVGTLDGEHLKKGVDEAHMVIKIANDVSNKLITTLSNYSGDFVRLEAHIEEMNSRLCLESEETRIVGIVGPSGIGKSTIGRALYGQKDIEISESGLVEQRLKDKKVLIVLDDVVELTLLTTLVGKTEWFGRGSRIIVITQNMHLLKDHNINLIYEVKFPSEDLALEMLCRSTFGQNSPPDGFKEVAVEVAKLAGNLPLGLSVLGSSLKGKVKREWVAMLHALQNELDGNIEKTLRVSYDRLNSKYQEMFLYVACLINGKKISYIQEVLRDSSVNIGLNILAEKSLVRITPHKTVEMHNLLQKLGREIVRVESIDPRVRVLTDADDI